MSDGKVEAALTSGTLARAGLMDEDRMTRSKALLNDVADAQLETIRVLFTDQHGVLRGKTLVAGALSSVLANGIAVPSSLLLKDTSHRTVFPVWNGEDGPDAAPMRGAGDILLVPDPDTFKRLPWSPHSAWILCDAVYKSGEPIAFDPRTVLKSAIARLAGHNMRLVVGLEIEFHVFQTVDPALEHADATMPGQPPQTRLLAPGYQFLTETRYAALEPVMDELRRTCEQMGMPVRSMEVEMGPSQFEFTFEPDDPLAHADRMVMFRTMVKEVCAIRGLHATFMCRPRVENGASSGWHLHQSVVDIETGANLFEPGANEDMSTIAGQWMAGLLAHAEESCLLTTLTVNGYKRYQPFQLAPDRIQWGRDNRGTMLRALFQPGDATSRIENRVAETAANPYFFFASQILSGLSGVDQKLAPPAACETPYGTDDQHLPTNLLDAIRAFETSALYRASLGDAFVDYLVKIKQAEWDRYALAVSHWEQSEYFSLY
ncbi:MAG: glutamine synthetase family protein [Pseudomonadota bacterium]